VHITSHIITHIVHILSRLIIILTYLSEQFLAPQLGGLFRSRTYQPVDPPRRIRIDSRVPRRYARVLAPLRSFCARTYTFVRVSYESITQARPRKECERDRSIRERERLCARVFPPAGVRVSFVAGIRTGHSFNAYRAREEKVKTDRKKNNVAGARERACVISKRVCNDIVCTHQNTCHNVPLDTTPTNFLEASMIGPPLSP